MISTFLFDLDGTLLDSVQLILSSFRHTSIVHRGKPLPDAHWLQGIGTPLRDQLGTIAQSEDELQAMLRTYRAHNLAHHDQIAKPFPGAADAVRQLHARGAKLALVTSKLRSGAERGLRLLGLQDELRVRICADDVTHGKPHPEPVLKALDALEARADEAIFVGDSPHDMQAGHAAHVRTAAVEWGPFERTVLEASRPDVWLHSFAQLLVL